MPKPFPHIPRIDNELPLEGLPQNAEESVFLSIPRLGKMADSAVEFKKSNSEGRRKVIESLARKLVDDPVYLTDSLDAAAFLRVTSSYDAQLFEEKLNETMEKRFDRGQFGTFPPKPETLETWLTIATQSDLYRPLAERALRRMFEKCGDVKSITDLIYALALGGFRSSNQNIVRKTFEIICYATDIFLRNSKQAIFEGLSHFDSNDEVLQKALEIDAVIVFLGQSMMPELYAGRMQAITEMMSREEFSASMNDLLNKNPERMRKLIALYDREQDELGLSRFHGNETINPDDFPYTILLRNIGPLRKWYNERLSMELASRRGEVAINLNLPTRQGVHQEMDLDRLSRFICDELSRKPASGVEQVIEMPEYWQTLAFLVPKALGQEEVRIALINANEDLKRNMREDSHYLLSPRGDLIEISDNILRNLGFHSIFYKMDKRNKRDTIVTIGIGNYHYRILLDEYFALRDFKTRIGITLPKEGVFLEHAILSFLHEIRCSDRVFETGSERSGATQRQFISRRAHRRILPEGQNPTKEQIERIFREYDIDLVRMNREFAARGETRKRTFVSEIQTAAAEGLGPVRSHAPNAIHRLQEIIETESS